MSVFKKKNRNVLSQFSTVALNLRYLYRKWKSGWVQPSFYDVQRTYSVASVPNVRTASALWTALMSFYTYSWNAKQFLFSFVAKYLCFSASCSAHTRSIRKEEDPTSKQFKGQRKLPTTSAARWWLSRLQKFCLPEFVRLTATSASCWRAFLQKSLSAGGKRKMSLRDK